MNPHSLRLLDFDIVRGELLDHCWSGDGKKRLLSDGFTHREEELEKIRSLVAGFRRLFTGDMERPSLSMPEIGDAMALAEKPGAALEAPELAAAASYFRQAKTIKTCLSRGGSPLAEEGADLPDLSGTAAKIGKIVGPDGEIRENDIPSLVEIRRRVRSLRRGLDEMARSYLENPAYRGYWQSDTVSQKDGRVVLPLGANFRGRLRGVVHEYSSRGATAFFEPLDIFDGNNRSTAGRSTGCSGNSRPSWGRGPERSLFSGRGWGTSTPCRPGRGTPTCTTVSRRPYPGGNSPCGGPGIPFWGKRRCPSTSRSGMGRGFSSSPAPTRGARRWR